MLDVFSSPPLAVTPALLANGWEFEDENDDEGD
jgi:hypothetical protein